MTRRDWNWFYIVPALWVTLGVVAFFPASYWFSVDRIRVFDTTQGVPPRMEIDRTIRRPFNAEWLVTVMREGKDGFYTFCTAKGENDYRPSSAFPDVLDLDWWTWPNKCPLPPGRYLIKTIWRLSIPGMPEKNVLAQSNIFTVK